MGDVPAKPRTIYPRKVPRLVIRSAGFLPY
jgi:hypothetical protein